jgi:hypothetical protein
LLELGQCGAGGDALLENRLRFQVAGGGEGLQFGMFEKSEFVDMSPRYVAGGATSTERVAFFLFSRHDVELVSSAAT